MTKMTIMVSFYFYYYHLMATAWSRDYRVVWCIVRTNCFQTWSYFLFVKRVFSAYDAACTQEKHTCLWRWRRSYLIIFTWLVTHVFHIKITQKCTLGSGCCFQFCFPLLLRPKFIFSFVYFILFIIIFFLVTQRCLFRFVSGKLTIMLEKITRQWQ